MALLLSEISMNLGTAFMSYGIKFIMYAAVAAAGIALGIKFRKNKDNKQTNE